MGSLLFPLGIVAILLTFLSTPDCPLFTFLFSRLFGDKHTMISFLGCDSGLRGLLFATLHLLPQHCRILFLSPATSPRCGLYICCLFRGSNSLYLGSALIASILSSGSWHDPDLCRNYRPILLCCAASTFFLISSMRHEPHLFFFPFKKKLPACHHAYPCPFLLSFHL